MTTRLPNSGRADSITSAMSSSDITRYSSSPLTCSATATMTVFRSILDAKIIALLYGQRKLRVAAGDRLRIYRLTCSRDRLKVHTTVGDLQHQKRQIGIEGSFRQRRTFLNIPLTELAARACNKILNAILRFNSFVDVVVAGENNVYAVPNKDRLERPANAFGRPVPAAGGIRRVMEKRYLPFRVILCQFSFKPLDLGLLEINTIQGVERRDAFLEPVILLAAHIE